MKTRTRLRLCLSNHDDEDPLRAAIKSTILKGGRWRSASAAHVRHVQITVFQRVLMNSLRIETILRTACDLNHFNREVTPSRHSSCGSVLSTADRYAPAFFFRTAVADLLATPLRTAILNLHLNTQYSIYIHCHAAWGGGGFGSKRGLKKQ